MNEKELLSALFEKISRHSKKADMHSFRANIKNGVVFCDCVGKEISMLIITYDGLTEKRERWYGKTNQSIDRLVGLGVDVESIEV